MKKINVLIVCDDVAMSSEIRDELKKKRGFFNVFSISGDPKQSAENKFLSIDSAVTELKPDVVLVQLKSMLVASYGKNTKNPIVSCETKPGEYNARIKQICMDFCHRTRIIVLSPYYSEALLIELWKIGLWEFFMEPVSAKILSDCIIKASVAAFVVKNTDEDKAEKATEDISVLQEAVSETYGLLSKKIKEEKHRIVQYDVGTERELYSDVNPLTYKLAKILEPNENKSRERNELYKRQEYDEAKTEVIVRKTLAEIGVSPKHSGYEFIAMAVTLLLIDKHRELATGRMTKEIYPKIAECYNKNEKSIERCIRTSIVKSFENSDEEVLKRVFKNTSYRRGLIPTNAEFVWTLVDYIRREEMP